MKRNTFYKSEVCSWPSIIPPLYLLRRSLFSLSMWRNIGSKIFLYKNVPQLTPLSIWEICFTINALFTLPLWDTNGMRAWITSPPMSWVETLIKLKWIEEKKTALAFVVGRKERCFKTECFWVESASNINRRAIIFVGANHSHSSRCIWHFYALPLQENKIRI